MRFPTATLVSTSVATYLYFSDRVWLVDWHVGESNSHKPPPEAPALNQASFTQAFSGVHNHLLDHVHAMKIRDAIHAHILAQQGG